MGSGAVSRSPVREAARISSNDETEMLPSSYKHSLTGNASNVTDTTMKTKAGMHNKRNIRRLLLEYKLFQNCLLSSG